MKFGKKKSKKIGDVLENYDMFGPEPWTRWIKSHIFIVIICIAVIAAGIIFYVVKPPGNGDEATNKAAQATLQTSLQSALNQADDNQIIDITGQLIGGQQKGIYHFDNATLSEYYLDRAASYINQKQYGKVQPDAEAAANLSSTASNAALAFEFQARYQLGERQQLIPLINRLIQSEQNSMNPMKSSAVAQYQQDITMIQHNQEIAF